MAVGKIAEEAETDGIAERKEDAEDDEAEIVDAPLEEEPDDDLERQLTLHFAFRSIMKTLFATTWRLDVQDISIVFLTLEKEALTFGLDEIRLEKSYIDFDLETGSGEGSGGKTWKVAKTTRDLRNNVENFLRVSHERLVSFDSKVLFMATASRACD